jgi:hypothetical protein
VTWFLWRRFKLPPDGIYRANADGDAQQVGR